VKKGGRSEGGKKGGEGEEERQWMFDKSSCLLFCRVT